MNKGIYGKLAYQSVSKNKNIFYPFLLSGTVMVAMFYILSSILVEVNHSTFIGNHSMAILLDIGQKICGFFSALIIFYTNRFLMKKQSKEFGLYSMLGMEKRHLIKVILWETVGLGAFCTIAGILTGVVFSKLLYMVLLKLLRLHAAIEFNLETTAVIWTVILYIVVFALLLIFNCIQILRMKPMELMREDRAGEKEPKAKWLLALIGLGCLGFGYYFALTTKNPMQALDTFFPAVLLVIIGTYLLFMSGSIALIKLLKKNKKFYYHKKHFVTVSGLMYRMKQNAVGLASICILSTAVLVVLSTTVCLYAAMDDILDNRFPKDVMVNVIMETEEQEKMLEKGLIQKASADMAKKKHVKLGENQAYYGLSCSVQKTENGFSGGINDFDKMINLQVIPLADYNAMCKENETLQPDEVLLWSDEAVDTKNALQIGEKTYHIKKVLQGRPDSGDTGISGVKEYFMVVSDLQQLKKVRNSLNETYSYGELFINYYYNFNLSGKKKDKISYCETVRDAYLETGIDHIGSVDNRYTSEQDFYDIFGSLLFIGLFIGALFLMTTVMIIYYKQISEGYDDKDRFLIMQKVGMSQKEVKDVIQNQILLVFFLPLVVAIIHIAFAFNIVCKMLSMFYMGDTGLYVLNTVITIVVFAVVYALIYRATARQYYRITSMKTA